MSDDTTLGFTPKRAMQTYRKLMHAAGTTSSRIQRGVIAEESLTESQTRVLEALEEFGPLTHSKLADKLQKTGGNITLVIDNLEKRSLVERVRSRQDRRSVEVHLTRRGRRLIRRVYPRWMREIAEEMSALTAAEQEELSRLCRKLGQAEAGT